LPDFAVRNAYCCFHISVSHSCTFALAASMAFFFFKRKTFIGFQYHEQPVFNAINFQPFNTRGSILSSIFGDTALCQASYSLINCLFLSGPEQSSISFVADIKINYQGTKLPNAGFALYRIIIFLFIIIIFGMNDCDMKLLQTEITPGTNSYISLLERDESYFKAPFHFHPELELVYIKEGYGKRIIGDTIKPFEAGDMVFIGSNLPHVWLCDELFYKGFNHLRAKAIVLYFNKNVFDPAFYDMHESGKINDFFKKAARGFCIEGKAKELVAQKLEKLLKKKDFDRTIGLFEILHLLSVAKQNSFITSDGYTQLKVSETDRLAAVYKYVQNHYSEDINLNTIAGIANLTPQSFCRLFKKRTNKHFIEYLNEIRISNVCRYLLDTDLSISEIAYNCGYKNLSNFNKLFKDITGINPKAYRAKAK